MGNHWTNVFNKYKEIISNNGKKTSGELKRVGVLVKYDDNSDNDFTFKKTIKYFDDVPLDTTKAMYIEEILERFKKEHYFCTIKKIKYFE